MLSTSDTPVSCSGAKAQQSTDRKAIMAAMGDCGGNQTGPHPVLIGGPRRYHLATLLSRTTAVLPVPPIRRV